MPVVHVHYNKANLDPEFLPTYTLAAVVARSLSTGIAPSVSAENVLVFFHAMHSMDVCSYDVVILVTAHDFPDRVRVHQMITSTIMHEVAKLLLAKKFCVIVNLTPLEFAVA